jgi:hypothetical protein
MSEIHRLDFAGTTVVAGIGIAGHGRSFILCITAATMASAAFFYWRAPGSIHQRPAAFTPRVR